MVFVLFFNFIYFCFVEIYFLSKFLFGKCNVHVKYCINKITIEKNVKEIQTKSKYSCKISIVKIILNKFVKIYVKSIKWKSRVDINWEHIINIHLFTVFWGVNADVKASLEFCGSCINVVARNWICMSKLNLLYNENEFRLIKKALTYEMAILT